MFDQIIAVRTFDAALHVVRETWVSSSTVVSPVTKVQMDPTVGGRLRISTGGPPESDLVGVFIVAEPQRLVYTWRWGESPEETMVDVRFHAAGVQTVVEVRHSGFVDDERRATHRDGWQSYFTGLALHLTGVASSFDDVSR